MPMPEMAREMSPEEFRAFTRTHLTHKETAFSLGVCTSTLTRWRMDGKISPVRPFAPYFYAVPEVWRVGGFSPL
ncbi:MAG: hypothetical protein LBK99_06545 [Opitutaceae bacterium]|nr:hypothetical protein [Opitutaceae bacterium]